MARSRPVIFDEDPEVVVANMSFQDESLFANPKFSVSPNHRREAPLKLAFHRTLFIGQTIII